MDRILVWLSAAICAGIGLFVLAAPDRAAASVEIVLGTPTARIDFTATYGGMCVGIAAWLGFCGLRVEFLRSALFGVAAVFGGLALGRLVAIAGGAHPEPIMWAFLAIELSFAAAAAARLRAAAAGGV